MASNIECSLSKVCDILQSELQKCVKEKFERLREHDLVAEIADRMDGSHRVMKQWNSLQKRSSRFASKTSRRSTEPQVSRGIKRLKNS